MSFKQYRIKYAKYQEAILNFLIERNYPRFNNYDLLAYDKYNQTEFKRYGFYILLEFLTWLQVDLHVKPSLLELDHILINNPDEDNPVIFMYHHNAYLVRPNAEFLELYEKFKSEFLPELKKHFAAKKRILLDYIVPKFERDQGKLPIANVNEEPLFPADLRMVLENVNNQFVQETELADVQTIYLDRLISRHLPVSDHLLVEFRAKFFFNTMKRVINICDSIRPNQLIQEALERMVNHVKKDPRLVLKFSMQPLFFGPTNESVPVELAQLVFAFFDRHDFAIAWVQKVAPRMSFIETVGRLTLICRDAKVLLDGAVELMTLEPVNVILSSGDQITLANWITHHSNRSSDNSRLLLTGNLYQKPRPRWESELDLNLTNTKKTRISEEPCEPVDFPVQNLSILKERKEDVKSGHLFSFSEKGRESTPIWITPQARSLYIQQLEIHLVLEPHFSEVMALGPLVSGVVDHDPYYKCLVHAKCKLLGNASHLFMIFYHRGIWSFTLVKGTQMRHVKLAAIRNSTVVLMDNEGNLVYNLSYGAGGFKKLDLGNNRNIKRLCCDDSRFYLDHSHTFRLEHDARLLSNTINEYHTDQVTETCVGGQLFCVTRSVDRYFLQCYTDQLRGGRPVEIAPDIQEIVGIFAEEVPFQYRPTSTLNAFVVIVTFLRNGRLEWRAFTVLSGDEAIVLRRPLINSNLSPALVLDLHGLTDNNGEKLLGVLPKPTEFKLVTLLSFLENSRGDASSDAILFKQEIKDLAAGIIPSPSGSSGSSSSSEMSEFQRGKLALEQQAIELKRQQIENERIRNLNRDQEEIRLKEQALELKRNEQKFSWEELMATLAQKSQAIKEANELKRDQMLAALAQKQQLEESKRDQLNQKNSERAQVELNKILEKDKDRELKRKQLRKLEKAKKKERKLKRKLEKQKEKNRREELEEKERRRQEEREEKKGTYIYKEMLGINNKNSAEQLKTLRSQLAQSQKREEKLQQEKERQKDNYESRLENYRIALNKKDESYRQEIRKLEIHWDERRRKEREDAIRQRESEERKLLNELSETKKELASTRKENVVEKKALETRVQRLQENLEKFREKKNVELFKLTKDLEAQARRERLDLERKHQQETRELRVQLNDSDTQHSREAKDLRTQISHLERQLENVNRQREEIQYRQGRDDRLFELKQRELEYKYHIIPPENAMPQIRPQVQPVEDEPMVDAEERERRRAQANALAMQWQEEEQQFQELEREREQKRQEMHERELNWIAEQKRIEEKEKELVLQAKEREKEQRAREEKEQKQRAEFERKQGEITQQRLALLEQQKVLEKSRAEYEKKKEKQIQEWAAEEKLARQVFEQKLVDEQRKHNEAFEKKLALEANKRRALFEDQLADEERQKRVEFEKRLEAEEKQKREILDGEIDKLQTQKKQLEEELARIEAQRPVSAIVVEKKKRAPRKKKEEVVKVIVEEEVAPTVPVIYDDLDQINLLELVGLSGGAIQNNGPQEERVEESSSLPWADAKMYENNGIVEKERTGRRKKKLPDLKYVDEEEEKEEKEEEEESSSDSESSSSSSSSEEEEEEEIKMLRKRKMLDEGEELAQRVPDDD